MTMREGAVKYHRWVLSTLGTVFAIRAIVVSLFLLESQIAKSSSREDKLETTTPRWLPIHGRLVISMKTMPSRIRYIQPTLDSLLFNQTTTMKVDVLYLVLPKPPSEHDPYVIPPFLQSYKNRGLVTILRPSHDYGAIDKLIHTLRAESLSSDCRILYVDDDVIYASDFIEKLARKGGEYPDRVVAFSGAKLRSMFRQVKHSNERLDHHPNLYFRTSGYDLNNDQVVDIVQGFMGVLVHRSFFNVDELFNIVQVAPLPVLKNDDFIICGYLESRGVLRMLVDGGRLPRINTEAATTDNLGKLMHRHVMNAAAYIQSRLTIWQNYTFVNLTALPKHVRDMIDCEAGHVRYCPDGQQKGKYNTLIDDSFRNFETSAVDDAAI